MDAGASPVKSILEKPLKELTEEDISQLTREDCRKFLKEKGMRRPSWNKSQAIQQVLSLKALFEPGDDSGAGVLRKILVSPPENSPRVTSNSVETAKELGSVSPIPSPEDENGPCQLKDPPRSAELGGQFVAEKESGKRVPPRSPGETEGPVEQMIIFYSGKVNVYDGLSPEKAQAIIHFAASSIDLPQNDSWGGNATPFSFMPHVQMTTDRGSLAPPREKLLEFPQFCQEKCNATRDPGTNDVEGQANRKVSLQRYREKRKDRGRFFKGKKVPGVASSGLEMYLSPQSRLNTSHGQSSRSSTASPPQPGLQHVFCSSGNNQTNNANLSTEQNSKDV